MSTEFEQVQKRLLGLEMKIKRACDAGEHADQSIQVMVEPAIIFIGALVAVSLAAKAALEAFQVARSLSEVMQRTEQAAQLVRDVVRALNAAESAADAAIALQTIAELIRTQTPLQTGNNIQTPLQTGNNIQTPLQTGNNIRCAFCGRAESDVFPLARGAGGALCEDCSVRLARSPREPPSAEPCSFCGGTYMPRRVSSASSAVICTDCITRFCGMWGK